jgi:putative aminopeptidase FrvX
MFVAHMDEVGLIVRRITPKGFLKVERLGGMSVHVLPGSPLDLWTVDGRLDAHVGAMAAHLVDGDGQPDLAGLFVDVGADSAEEARAMGIQVGDGLTWHAEPCVLNEKRLRGKALDDRLGCYALIRLAWLLAAHPVEQEVTLAFVPQEEGALLEAATVIRQVDPEVVIGVDGTLTFDTPDIDEPQSEIALGGGPCLKMMDAIRGKSAYFPNWELTNRIREALVRAGTPFQPEVVVGLTTALNLMPFMNAGVRTAGLSLPIRYHHAPVETADLSDLAALIEVLLALLTQDVLV